MQYRAYALASHALCQYHAECSTAYCHSHPTLDQYRTSRRQIAELTMVLCRLHSASAETMRYVSTRIASRA
eukprot:370851-Rhodomonas_salina.1